MAYHGKGGNLVYNSGNIANLQSYSLTRIGEVADVTSMGDTWDVFIAGLTDFNATAEGLSQVGLDTTALLGTGADAEFVKQSSGVNDTAAVIVTGITETATIDGAITVSYTFEGNDADGFTNATTGGASATASTNAIHGKTIKANWDAGTPTDFIDVTGWSVTMSCTTSDATAAHATNTGRLKLAGTNNATATVTILTPATDLVVKEGTSITLKLYRSQTTSDGYYTGTAICTGSDAGVDRTGTETTTLNFQFTGVVDLAVA